MKTTNTLTPIPIAPAIPAILEALGLGALIYGASEAASESDSDSFGESGSNSFSPSTPQPTT